MSHTFLMVKPDGVARGLTGEVISRVERKGYSISRLKKMTISDELAREHYGEHVDKPFFGELVSFITSGPVVAMVVEGEDVVSTIRRMVGVTDPKEAAPGTIRGDYAVEIGSNIVHASDSDESAAREIKLFFR
ncbi:MAG TPA: nucleoside-diphosphate kinase [Nitrospirae bacterium]|nr:nucleoside diphosphate kinase [archaeon BMS3Abin16]GBE56005.1 nucleoside diphosphate kinase [archaeon BMS3Bbin16]HDH00954.1 nucleoside-diphosphate kinase [Nitrospirota bacterium]HDH27589.1 nucleoside-diphosphate kinase [Euryarchaeota archaeon]